MRNKKECEIKNATEEVRGKEEEIIREKEWANEEEKERKEN